MDPHTMNGIGRRAIHATEGARSTNAPPMTRIVVASWSSSFAPMSRKRSSWLMSSLSTDIRPPELRSS